MAYIPIIGDIFQVSVYAHVGGQAAVSDYHFEVTASAGVGAVTDQDICDDLDAAFADIWKALLGNGATYDGVTVRLEQSAPRPVTKFSNAHPGPGLAGADLLPLQSTGLLSFRTEFGGKSQRGRTYFPFPSTADDINPGEPTLDYVARLSDLGTFIITPRDITIAFHTTTITWGMWTRILPTVHASPITAFTAHKVWATQKRRGAFGRLNKGPF